MSKVAIVTGGSSGIGKEIALKLQQEGYQSVSWDLNAPDSTDQLPYIQCDVSSESSVSEAASQTQKKYGDISILVNNCGLQYMSPVDEFPKEKWDLLISVMLTGTFLCIKNVLPQMKANGFGRIINISSVHGKLASPYKAAYVAAKHGVHGLAKVVAQEMASKGITVNTVCPGFVDTPLMRNQVAHQMELNQLSEEDVLSEIFLKQQSIKQLTQTSQVADMVYFLTTPSASTITGEAFNISGGWGMGL